MTTQETILLVRSFVADPICADILVVDVLPVTGEPNFAYCYPMESANYDGQYYIYKDNAWGKATIENGDAKIQRLIQGVGVCGAAKIILLQQIEAVSMGSSTGGGTGALASANIGSLSVSFDVSGGTVLTVEQKVALWKEKLNGLDAICALMFGGGSFEGFHQFSKRPIGGVIENI